jgi:hypothetical protein
MGHVGRAIGSPCWSKGRAHIASERLSTIAAASGTDWVCGIAALSRALLAEGDTADS